MSELIAAIFGLAVLALGGAAWRSNKRNREADEQVARSRELDKEAERTDTFVKDARAHVEDLEERITEREKESTDVEASDPESAADRLRREFSGGPDPD